MHSCKTMNIYTCKIARVKTTRIHSQILIASLKSFFGKKVKIYQKDLHFLATLKMRTVHGS